jgi:hypothetical protein
VACGPWLALGLARLRARLESSLGPGGEGGGVPSPIETPIGFCNEHVATKRLLKSLLVFVVVAGVLRRTQLPPPRPPLVELPPGLADVSLSLPPSRVKALVGLRFRFPQRENKVNRHLCIPCAGSCCPIALNRTSVDCSHHFLAHAHTHEHTHVYGCRVPPHTRACSPQHR